MSFFFFPFCATLKQFAPLRAKSIKAWNQRRGRDAAQRSHGSQGAPQDVTGQKTLHPGLPFPPLFARFLSPDPAINSALFPHYLSLSFVTPNPPSLALLFLLLLTYFICLRLCFLLHKFSFFIFPPFILSSSEASSASPEKIKCIWNIIIYELDLLLCVCVLY